MVEYSFKTHLRIIFGAETGSALSENCSAGGCVTEVTLTSDGQFAAKAGWFMARKVILR
jgi:hypothetical protein